VKEKFSFWLLPETKAMVEENYSKDCCQNQSEFVEKAIRFYSGYINATRYSEYLPKTLSAILEGSLGQFGDRIGRLLFKAAVEQGISNHLIAADSDLDYETLDKLRAKVVNDVKRTNGQITFKEALKFQKEL